MIGSHGLCGCATCYALGYVNPVRDWVVTRLSIAEWNGNWRIEGENLNCAPGAWGRKFTWYGYREFGHVLDKRYDFSKAEIAPEVMEVMERWNLRQEAA